MKSRATPQLLERLLAEHGSALELFAAQWSATPEDCVQEALIELARRESLPRRVIPWLYRVVRNRAISSQRKQVRRHRHEAAAGEQSAKWFVPRADDAVDAEEVVAALRSLDEPLREVIVARIWGRLGFEQIGEVVGCGRSTAHRRYEAGLKALRDKLGLNWPAHETRLS